MRQQNTGAVLEYQTVLSALTTDVLALQLKRKERSGLPGLFAFSGLSSTMAPPLDKGSAIFLSDA
ncbi:hypothetical protein ASF29_08410 [Rhizobium sp. Leaf262]|nr:hypothetical protein ASF29_08410 [Rhizobium sp. Leaf262]